MKLYKCEAATTERQTKAMTAVHLDVTGVNLVLLAVNAVIVVVLDAVKDSGRRC